MDYALQEKMPLHRERSCSEDSTMSQQSHQQQQQQQYQQLQEAPHESQLVTRLINAAYIGLNTLSTVAIVFLNKMYPPLAYLANYTGPLLMHNLQHLQRRPTCTLPGLNRNVPLHHHLPRPPRLLISSNLSSLRSYPPLIGPRPSNLPLLCLQHRPLQPQPHIQLCRLLPVDQDSHYTLRRTLAIPHVQNYHQQDAPCRRGRMLLRCRHDQHKTSHNKPRWRHYCHCSVFDYGSVPAIHREADEGIGCKCAKSFAQPGASQCRRTGSCDAMDGQDA